MSIEDEVLKYRERLLLVLDQRERAEDLIRRADREIAEIRGFLVAADMLLKSRLDERSD